MYIPDQGDIVIVDFEPSAGTEIMKRRPAIVLTRKTFNQHTNLAIVAPVTSKIRGVDIEVVLPDEMGTHGSVLVTHMKSMDFSVRSMDFVEKATQSVLKEVQDKVGLILS